MSLQARMSPDDQRLYNANRDLAHCFRKAVMEVGNRLEDRPWNALARYMDLMDLTDEQLGDAVAAFIKFIQMSCDDPKEKMEDVLVRSGWFEAKPAAQVAHMATLGTVMAGMFFHGVREAHVKGFESPLAKLEELQASGRRSAKLLALPRWRRPLVRWAAALRRIVNAIRSQNTTVTE